MSTRPETIAILRDQLAGLPGLSVRAMFGDYALYANGKVVALVCDDQVFLKPTPGVRALIADPVEAAPYPGAKPHLLLGTELDDPEILAALIRRAAADLPAPKPRAARARSARGKSA